MMNLMIIRISGPIWNHNRPDFTKPGRFQVFSNQARAGFGGIRVITTIDADMTRAEKEQYLREIDERCPISDNIHRLTPMEFVVAKACTY